MQENIEQAAQTYTKEEVVAATREYFGGDELAADTFLKYALKNENGAYLEKTPTDMHDRLAKEFARIEQQKYINTALKPLSYEEIYELFDHFKYLVPQGSPMYGIGNNLQIVSLSNCYFLDIPSDSYNSILDIDKQLVNISKRRGGTGICLDNLRPKGFPTKNSSRTSTGIVTWMKRYSHSIREVGQDNRRGALMMLLSVHHPDILDFSTIKNNNKEVTGANISVKLTKEFIDAVKNDTEYELRFPLENPTFTKKVRAKDVWNVIIKSAHMSAEPGLVMWSNYTENTPADCYEEYCSQGLNPCAELNLHSLDSCRLLCINLLSYVQNPYTKTAAFDFELFTKHSKIAQRLMDDLVDLESEKIEQIIQKIDSDPEPEEIKRDERKMWATIKKNNDEGRRTGTGIVALGDTFAALNIKYGSQKSIELSNEIFKALKLACYESSVEMAKDLGTFVGYNAQKEKDCKFILKLKEEDPNLYKRMIKYGRRNVSLLTISPTGSTSILTQTTSGIEPLFQISYTRRKKITNFDKNTRIDFVDKTGDKWQEFTVYHPQFKKWSEINGDKNIENSPWYKSCADDIDWKQRIKLQSMIQSHVCHGVSSTVNLPENTTEETVAQIYTEAFSSGCKGITIYRKGCRDGVLISKDSKDKKKDGRPRELPCEVHHVTVKGVKYLVMIGLENGRPYEVFSCKNGKFSPNIKSGKIIRAKKDFYKAEFEDGTELSPITLSTTDMEDAVTRLTSALLRSNADINTIVTQLEKVEGDVHCYAKAIARALKHHIKDGEKIEGEVCPECGAQVIRVNGCWGCEQCFWTRCS